MTFSAKFGGPLSNLLKIKCTKLYSDLVRFDISIVQCLGVYFFYRTQCINADRLVISLHC